MLSLRPLVLLYVALSDRPQLSGIQDSSQSCIRATTEGAPSECPRICRGVTRAKSKDQDCDILIHLNSSFWFLLICTHVLLWCCRYCHRAVVISLSYVFYYFFGAKLVDFIFAGSFPVCRFVVQCKRRISNKNTYEQRAPKK